MHETVEKHAQLRSAIVDAAAETVRVSGVGALQARKLAASARCSVGTLYNVCGSMDEVLAEVNLRTLARLKDVLSAASTQAQDPTAEGRLCVLGGAYISYAVNNATSWRALVTGSGSARAAGPSEVDVSAGYEGVIAVFRGIAENEPDAEALAYAVFSAVHGLSLVAVDPVLGAVQRPDPQAVLRLLVGERPHVQAPGGHETWPVGRR